MAFLILLAKYARGVSYIRNGSAALVDKRFGIVDRNTFIGHIFLHQLMAVIRRELRYRPGARHSVVFPP